MGFKLKHNEYTPRTGEDKGKRIEYWSAERDTKMKSGQRLRVTISQYEQPELDGAIGVSIYVPAEGSVSFSPSMCEHFLVSSKLSTPALAASVSQV